MKLAQIDRAIEACTEHLAQTNSQGTEVEAFLAQYLAVMICGAFEEEIERIVVERLAASNDPEIEAFARSALDAVFRSTGIREISGLLNRFNPEVKKRFQDRICGTRAETFFTNIVTHRHQTVHSGGTNVTVRELADFYDEGHTVLDAISGAWQP
jgi:hypothetical protein